MAAISSIKYSFRDAFRSMGRHKGMTLASVLTVAVSLFILGFAVLLVINSFYLVGVMESEVEISVFLERDTPRNDAQALINKLKQLDGFDSAKFVSKEEGLKSLQSRFGEDADIVNALGGRNPLPDMYRVKATDPQMVENLAREIKLLTDVQEVRYGQEWIEKLLSFAGWVRNIGIAIIAGILLAALFLITTTIRLTVLARSKEISIMRSVGATNWFIRFPFFLEGVFFGFIGAVIACLGVYFGYNTFIRYMVVSAPFIPIMGDKTMVMYVLASLVGGGTLLGSFASAIAVHKYLKL